jgi:hypothetical protein
MKKNILECLLIVLATVCLVWLLLLFAFVPEKNEFGEYHTLEEMNEILFCGGVNKC